MPANYTETALRFACAGEHLYGIVSAPQAPCTHGVLIVVGGPQYRAGSHRQFTLLARALAAQGVAAMRFDYRGMGDSEGATRRFDDSSDDIRAAIDAFMQAQPGLEKVVLWGLCDAASAISLYAGSDARVAGLVLLNPWVRTEQGLARATLRHYYRARLRDPAFWRGLLTGSLKLGTAIRSWLALLRTARTSAPSAAGPQALPDRMHAALSRHGGPILVILSGADLTAREFGDLATHEPKWRALLEAPWVTRRALDEADHTFSRATWRDQVASWTLDWVRSSQEDTVR